MDAVNPALTDREIRIRLEAVARQAVRSPAIDAVVLYGSRARGDFRPDSDWDVALIARSDCEHPDVAATSEQLREVDRHSAVEVWAKTREHLQRNADRSNQLAGAVATQGVPLAGKWPLAPAAPQGHRIMDLKVMRAKQGVVCRIIRDGWWRASMNFGRSEPRTRSVSHYSALAAEILAKEVVASRSALPVCSHDLNRLAEQLEGLPLQAWESEEQRRHEVETLRKMHGIPARLHIDFHGHRPAAAESLEKGVRRLLLAMDLQVRWLSRCASRGPDWNRAARDAGGQIVDTAITIRGLPTLSEANLLDTLPDRAARAISDWEASARRLIQSPARGHAAIRRVRRGRATRRARRSRPGRGRRSGLEIRLPEILL